MEVGQQKLIFQVCGMIRIHVCAYGHTSSDEMQPLDRQSDEYRPRSSHTKLPGLTEMFVTTMVSQEISASSERSALG